MLAAHPCWAGEGCPHSGMAAQVVGVWREGGRRVWPSVCSELQWQGTTGQGNRRIIRKTRQKWQKPPNC